MPSPIPDSKRSIFSPSVKNRAAIRVVASYSEDQLITSDPRQLLEIEEEKRAFAESLEEEEEEEEE